VSNRTLEIYTISNWTVKRGRDTEFVTAWKVFADWMVLQRGTGPASLFKDDLDPAHYISIESWEDESTRAAIQKGVPFGRQSYKLQQLTIDFSSRSFKKEGEMFPLPPSNETNLDIATQESGE
jgi:antibiotic biosynthesis monooxygenase